MSSATDPSPRPIGNTRSTEWPQALGQLDKRRVVPCTWEGAPAFAKRAKRPQLLQTLLMFFFAPMLRRWLWPGSFERARRSPATPFEVQRLAELRAAGVAVPRVLAVTAQAFVMSEAGIPLDTLLHNLATGSERCKWFYAVALDLSLLHQRGIWHGGAQVRNMAVSEDGLTRFDFDRALDLYFPLPMLQAHDAALMLASLADYRDADALKGAARQYLEGAPTGAVQVIRRCMGPVGALARSRILHALAPKEARRIRALHRALAQAQVEREAPPRPAELAPGAQLSGSEESKQ